MHGICVQRSLEVGCGYGRLAPIFAEFSKEHTAIDINPSAIATGRSCYPWISFGQASVTALPFPDKHFGFVTSWTVLQHIRPSLVTKSLIELRRVLQDDGLLLLCEASRFPDVQREHIWDRSVSFYAEHLPNVVLQWNNYITELDLLPEMGSPGEVMLFRAN